MEAARVEVVIEETAVAGAKLKTAVRVEVEIDMPEQNESLPHVLEETTVRVGQAFMRAYYRQAIEKADLELVLSNRAGKNGEGIQRIGTRPYRFKTRFGTIPVRKIRIKHKSDSSTEVPSSKAWKLPKPLCITNGLKNAACNLVVKQSFNSTVRQLERESGEKKLLSKSSVGNILHREGARLAEAQKKRAEQVYIQDSTAKSLLGRAEAFIPENFFEDVFLDGADLSRDLDEEELKILFEEIEWDPREPKKIAENSPVKFDITIGADASSKADAAIEAKPNLRTECDKRVEEAEAVEAIQRSEEVQLLEERSADAGASLANSGIASIESDQIVIEPDEVMVRSQEAGKVWLLHYTAVIVAAGRTYYLSAASSMQLLYEAASLLTALGVHTANKRLLLISDGARWIRYWFDGLGIKNKISVLCWHHLKMRCWRLIREGIKKKEDRLAVSKEVLRRLWRGEVEEARAYLSKIILDHEDGQSRIEIIDVKAIEGLREYLLQRRPHIPDYLSRVRAKEWIANTKVEKYNDWSISIRCKKQNGMKWTSGGVGAIAALEATRRNGELEGWRENGMLSSWASAVKKAA